MIYETNNDTAVFIRTAKKGEEGILYDLICELAEYEGKDISSLPLTKEKLNAFGFGDNPYFLTEFAVYNGQIVGYALYYYGFSGYQGCPILYLEDLYVKPAYRRMGIGSQLFKHVTACALQKECCRLEWHVFSWNTSAIEFYQKFNAVLRKDLIQVRLDREELKRIEK